MCDTKSTTSVPSLDVEHNRMDAALPSEPSLPLSTQISTSSSTCSISGNPPFTTTITYECQTGRPIWALIRLFTDLGNHIYILDPSRNNRRIGCSSAMIFDDWDEDALDFEDTILVRLQHGQTCSTEYTFAVEEKVPRLRVSDVHYMVKGSTYHLKLTWQRCKWMYEDEMGEGLSEQERKEMLRKQPRTDWRPDYSPDPRSTFTAVE